ncbi:MAG: type III pantothenate kinase [Paludibacteraceae bacterium]|nr:type III pantothenate kinase [Paludibacteraceae bacterium]
MNLCIDQGNTRTKTALFEGVSLLEASVIEPLDKNHLEKIFKRNHIQNTILSSVKEFDSELIKFLQKKSDTFIELTHTTPLPITNGYETPETLGKDRLAAVMGAYSLAPHKPILVIDAGTAITFDFINDHGVYLGGTISPGLEMRGKSLHHFTHKLPLVSLTGEAPLQGKNTEQAIRSGIINGLLFEINGYIQGLKVQYPELLIFLTGGDTFFFENKLKNVIFAEENLVLIGLNSIINYNVKI